MKKFAFTLVMCLMALIIHAQVSRTIVNTAGNLASNLGADLSAVTDLSVTGTMDARDFKTIRDNMPALERIDLSGASISAYSGENGTSTYIGTVTYSLNQLPTRAFYDGNPVPSTKLKSIKIPLNTTTLGANAFNYCQGLDSLFIPSTITNVSSALNYCSANYRVDIANSQYGNVDGVLFRKSGGQFTELVQYPTSKTGNYSIQVGVTKISSAAFAGNSGLSKVTIPTSLSSMSNNNIFNGCASLSQIVINRTTPPSSFINTFAPELFTQCSLVVPKNTTSAYRAALNWQNFVNILEPFTMVDTKSTASVTRNSAILNADIVNLGDSTISAHGFCWNTVGNPTISDEKIDKGAATSTGIYSHNLENLVSNQKYYVRAYAVNETRTVYGAVFQFTTLSAFELTTNAATTILQKSATLNGAISYSSPTSISNYGFCWNTTGSPTIVDSKEDLGVNPTAGAFTKNVTGLNGATTYYYRSFATANGNTVYGTQQSFTTALPDDYDITVQINGNGTVSSGTAISNGALVNVLRGATKTFTITPNAGYQITAITYDGVDVYSQVVNNQYTTPAVNAYSTLSVSFGNNTKTINVSTAGTLSTLLSAIDKSIITNLTVTGNIDARDVKCMRDEISLLAYLDLENASVKSYNGYNGPSYVNWTEVNYPVNEMPQYSFYMDKTSLKKIKLPKTIISIGESAFIGTGFDGSLTIPNSVQTIGMDAFNRTENVEKLILGSSVTSIKKQAFAGMAFESKLNTIICLSANPPVLENDVFTGKNPTVVYVPIGKVNSYKAATGWSSFNIVEYKLKPTTKSVSSIKLNSAKLSGSLDVITDSPVTAHGFCWNTTGMPTIADSKVDNGATTTEGTYSNIIDNLSGATTYYVRAFATDGTSGTVYGDEISFTTAEIPATSNLGGNYFNSQYWSKSKSPYTITDNVSLAEGTTLTIEPGVVVNFAGNYEIITLGSVIANGTANDSITFNANGNTCTFLDFKNTKLSDTELSYLKMIGYKNVPTLYAKALKTQGTCTDSLTLNNSRIETTEINCQKTVTINNSKIADLSAAASSLVLDNSSINYATFGESWTYGAVNVIIKNSTATGLNFNGDSYNSRNTILNSIVKSSNFGRSSTNVKKSRLYKCNFSAGTWENPTIKLDSTILAYTSLSLGQGSSTVTNCIFINDSTQTINLNGVTTKSQFIGDNKLGGVGIDAASGTITNSLISSSRIGALAGTLTINNSNFMNNSQHNIKNTGANTIDAKSNFWGVGNTTTAAVKSTIYDYYKDLTLGKVLYDNYLSTPNIDCPVMSPQNVQKTAVTEGVNYTWNANPESDIKGYKLYFGPFDGFTFANSVDVGNVTTYTLSNTSLTDIVLVTAYDQQADGKDDMIEGHESWYSAYIFPEKAGTITGSTSVCQGETSKVYTVPAIANATSYSWTLPVGATGTSTTNSIAVDFSSTAISGEITVKGQNDFGDGAVSALPITVNSVPTLSGAGIMGMNTVNQGQNSVSYDVYYSNATSYKWTLPEGATGTSTTNNITVNYSTSAKSGNITVTPINDCGEGAPTSLAITVRPLPGAAGTITGSANVCAGQSSVIYTVPAIENATSYIWTLPDGTYGYSSTNSITVNYYTYATSGNITVKGHNSIGNGTASILAVTVTQPVGMSGAEAVSGPKTVCLGEKSVIYTTPLVDNATMYEWTLPTGVTGTSSTNSITVDFGPTAISGSVFVKAKNSCFEGYGSGINVVVVQPIGNAGTISGATTVCQGENNVVYTVPAIDNATSYEWTLPTGATGTSTTNSISVNFAKTAISGNISVKGTNSCGTGLNSTIAITVNPLPADAGIITGKTSVCQGESSVTYTVPAIQNATSYIWYLPDGASGSSTTNSIDVDFNNSAVSGDIMVTGHNDCGDGVVSLLPITINQLPVISANDKTVICGGSVLLDPSINYSGSGTLEYSWSPTTGLNDATIANPTATLEADKTYTLTVKTPSGCTTSRNVTVKIIPMSKPNICMVGVHSSNKNIVVWEKPVSTGIDSYNIYRETNVTNVFDKIGSIPYNSTSVFIDNSSSPDVQSNSYKLTIVDKLGYESEQSNLHKTLHLSINKGLNATWNLNWEKYEGFTVSTYNVYRGTTVNNLALIGSTSGSSSQYSDVNAPTGDVYYQLEVVNPNPCTVVASLNASKKVKNLDSSVLELYSSSRSNIATNVLSGINNNNASGSIKIYPNPVHNELRLEYDGNARFEILNLVGQVLYNGILEKTALVETSNLFPGVYLIRFTQGKTVTTERFIKK